MLTADEITRLVHDAYTSLRYKPPQNQYTILAAFVLTHNTGNNSDDNDHAHLSSATRVSYSSSIPVAKIISLATGSKCLPTERFPLQGDALHDSHAEVLARRGARRWLLEEIARMCTSSDPDPLASRDTRDIIASSEFKSDWIEQCDDKLDDGDTTASSSRPIQFHLKPGVRLAMYISTVPCGDASTRYLASIQDPAMAALKDSSPTLTTTSAPTTPTITPSPSTGATAPINNALTTARGRNHYALLGALRTKPGRSDSPPTTCMSCSDKICAWGVLGVQGALASRLLCRPVYVDRVIIGGGDLVQEGEQEEAMRAVVREDCERAFYGRMERWMDGNDGDGSTGALLPQGYTLSRPTIELTSREFIHSRFSLPSATSSSNEALCWTADSPGKANGEVIINGLKRGIAPKHRLIPKHQPSLCKQSMLRLYVRTARMCGIPSHPPDTTYYSIKHSPPPLRDLSVESEPYQLAKLALMGPNGLLRSWTRSGSQWQLFIANAD